uniref:Uncharacterized protein n=1 Tax=Strongyloides venezuelensis TaxID=75913 RepID=A0A0K0G5J0_STRVS
MFPLCSFDFSSNFTSTSMIVREKNWKDKCDLGRRRIQIFSYILEILTFEYKNEKSAYSLLTALNLTSQSPVNPKYCSKGSPSIIFIVEIKINPLKFLQRPIHQAIRSQPFFPCIHYILKCFELHYVRV